MMLFQNILHVFTDRPYLCARSYVREFQQEEKQRASLIEVWAAMGMDSAEFDQAHGQQPPPEWALEYGHVVSRIGGYRWYAMDYEAAAMSKHRKAPVLVAEHGRHTAEDERVMMEQRRREFPGLKEFPEPYTPQDQGWMPTWPGTARSGGRCS